MKKIVGISLLFLLGVTILQSCYSVKKSEDYYGIKTSDIGKVVFVLDISGSMENIAERDVKGELINTATNVAADAAGSAVSHAIGGEAGQLAGSLLSKKTKKSLTKLQKARKKLIPAIKGLPESTLFNVIVFENGVRVWRKTMQPATDANKLQAQAYIESLKAGGGTNIYEAMEKAFEFAGPGATDETKPLDVESIFLLSDGEPSAGPVTSTEAVRKWNPLKRVKVHTIGLGDDCDEAFMRGLAADNGGVYIDK